MARDVHTATAKEKMPPRQDDPLQKTGPAQKRPDPDLVELEGWRVRRGREPYARELFAACARLGLARDYKGRPHLRWLADKVLHRNASLLVTELQAQGLPKLETLRDLDQVGGLPLARALVALRLLTPEAMAAELGVGLPDAPLSALGPEELEALLLMGRLAQRDPALATAVLALLRLLPQPPLSPARWDSGPAESPTT